MATQISQALPATPDKPAYMAEFLDLMPIPVAILTKIDGRIAVTNHALDELLGVEASSLWGGDACCLFPNITERRALLERFRAAQGVRGVQVSGRDANGRPLRLAVWIERAVCEGNECVIAVFATTTGGSLVEQRLQAAVSELRLRLQAAAESQELVASEIHDGVVQQTVGALMLLRAAKAAFEQHPERCLRQLDAVESALQQGLKEARQVMESARPSELDEIGLTDAVKAMLDRVSQSSGLPFHFSHSLRSLSIPPEIERDVYRVIQECANNIWFHSQATKASVELAERDGSLHVVISDDGQGFDPGQIKRGRRGLKGIRLRAEMRGGQCHIETAQGCGCTIRAIFSLRQQTATAAAAPR
jgi:signal transduction histidine kinase